MNIADLYHSRISNPLLNTSYPLHPEDWGQYQTSGTLGFDGEEDVSFYIHIPFCPHLCSYCEYTRMLLPTKELQQQYLDTLKTDILRFKAEHPHLTLKGFDIGGGTPTALNDDCFSTLLHLYDEATNGQTLATDFEPSIESTVGMLSTTKLEAIAQHGIRRVSLGLQSTSAPLLHEHRRREATTEELALVIDHAHDAGIKKVNIDLMYGLQHQTLESLMADLDVIQHVHPEQVTLYELRTNMTRQKPTHTADWLFEAYSLLFDRLTDLGYHAQFGQNTFSVSPNDQGLSSYLRHRMLQGGCYKGFGLSAQSMSHEGVAYNKGKNLYNIAPLLASNTFEEGHTYRLPPQELCSKYIAIAGYGGRFSLRHASVLLGRDAQEYFHSQITFCLQENLLSCSKNDTLSITPKGFRHHGAVFSLFYLP